VRFNRSKKTWWTAVKQQALAMSAKYETGFEQHRKPTRRDEFLETD